MIDNLVICAGVIAAATTALWILSLMIEDVSIVDIFWGPAFAVVGWTCFAVRDSELTITALLSLTMVSAWGLRLGGYLAWRNLGKGEDFRYQKMREKTGPSFRFKALFTVFYFQGALVLLVSLPVQVALGGDREAPLALLAAGVAIWAIGFLFEAIGDAQLARFKADPDNKGKVMDRGLWRYTRHPNYFGNFMMWWGLFALVAVQAPWTAIGPVVMTFLLLKVSGVAMLEKTIGKRRPGYQDYVRRTSAFFPWPPKGA